MLFLFCKLSFSLYRFINTFFSFSFCNRSLIFDLAEQVSLPRLEKMIPQLPVFWEDDVNLWLRFVENIFEIMNVTSEQDKINMVISALPPNLRTMVVHRLSLQPFSLTYEELQNSIIACTSADSVLDMDAFIPAELLKDDLEEPI